MAKRLRKHRPARKYKDYTSYRRFLRLELEYACAYCDVLESQLGGASSFHVEHYRPQERFEHLICDYDNLLYACRECNDFKGEYWPNFLQRFRGHYILDPFKFDVAVHIDKSNSRWNGLTPTGFFHINELQFQIDDTRVDFRDELVQAPSLLLEARKSLELAEKLLNESANDNEAWHEAYKACQRYRAAIRIYERLLARRLD